MALGIMIDPIRSLSLILVLAACDSAGGTFDDPANAGNPPVTADTTGPPGSILPDLIDGAIPPAVAGEDGWNYSRFAEVDLNGDGSPELVVLMARVEVYRGQPAWDDGQPWQVYVESADGLRTYLYARRLQLGSLDMRITTAATGTPAVILIEHLPDHFAIYEFRYAGPDDVAAFVPFERAFDPRGELASPRLP